MRVRSKFKVQRIPIVYEPPTLVPRLSDDYALSNSLIIGAIGRSPLFNDLHLHSRYLATAPQISHCVDFDKTTRRQLNDLEGKTRRQQRCLLFKKVAIRGGKFIAVSPSR